MLRTFDHSLSEDLTQRLDEGPVTLHKETQATKIERQDDGRLKVHLTTGKCIDDVDTLIFAVGRNPHTKALNAAKAVSRRVERSAHRTVQGIAMDDKGHIKASKGDGEVALKS